MRSYPPALAQRARFLVAVAVLIAVALIVLDRAPKIRTPQVVGASYASAAATLTRLQLCVTVDRRVGTTAPRLRVLAQSPAPGAQVESWSTVTISLADTPLPQLVLDTPYNSPCPHISVKVVDGGR